MATKRLWHGNIAISEDGFVSKKNQKTELSNNEDWIEVHNIRNNSSAIIIGSNTALIDNPRLLVKERYIQNTKIKQPIRILFDRRGRCPNSLLIFQDQEFYPTIWITNNSSQYDLIKKIEFISFSQVFNDINSYLDTKEDYRPVLIEGGSMLMNSFVNSGFMDMLRVYQSTKKLENGTPLKLNFDKLVLQSEYSLGDGVVRTYKILK